ncbi:MAG: pyridoxal-dependent decarboxylase, exosortase A system-associated [Roseibium album]|uniref:pyridoxal-dependent decarboxylase, exosortase A system-associated n=1 Tax=Roseibium album TaxID=311410 RepID=UPI0032EF1DE6
MSTLPTHGDIRSFEVEDNVLCIGGRKLTEVIESVGRTPVYLYDTSLITRRVEELRAALPPRLKLHYAIKANPLPKVVKHVAHLVDGLDVASGGELRVAIDTATPRHQISFAGPGKSDEELRASVESGIVINVESPNELLRVNRISRTLSMTARVAIRINPDFELKGSGMRMSGGPKPFGIDAEFVPDLLRQGLGESVRFEGLHIFSGSQNLNAAAICEAQQKSLELAVRLISGTTEKPRFINIGGGLGIPYFPGDKRLSLYPIGKNLESLIETAERAIPGVELVLELGRYVVGEAGIYVCTVVDKKVSRGQTFVITDGGLHHHLAASGNFGQILRKNYPLVVGNRLHGSGLESMNVVGPLCTPLDLLGHACQLPAETGVGDLIVVMQSGAYGATASPVNFLSHPPPLEVTL